MLFVCLCICVCVFSSIEKLSIDRLLYCTQLTNFTLFVLLRQKFNLFHHEWRSEKERCNVGKGWPFRKFNRTKSSHLGHLQSFFCVVVIKNPEKEWKKTTSTSAISSVYSALFILDYRTFFVSIFWKILCSIAGFEGDREYSKFVIKY